MTHTPGTWKSDGVLIWAGENVIAQACIEGTDYSEAVREANARLIAQAPAMLAELEADRKLLRLLFDRERVIHDSDDLLDEIKARLSANKAVIKKARGL